MGLVRLTKKCKFAKNCKYYNNNSFACKNNGEANYYCGIAKSWHTRIDAWKKEYFWEHYFKKKVVKLKLKSGKD